MVEDGCGLSHGSLVALSNDGSINGVKNGWRCKFNEPSRQQRRGTFQVRFYSLRFPFLFLAFYFPPFSRKIIEVINPKTLLCPTPISP